MDSSNSTDRAAERLSAVLLAKDVSVFEDHPAAARPGPHRLDARPRAD